jgi:hypothetical protein
MAKLILSEHMEQASFFSEIGYRYRSRPDFIPALFYAMVNGFYAAGVGARKHALLAKYRAEGWKSGIPDVRYDQPRGPHPFLVIEMKRADKRNTRDGGLRPEQIEYLDAARSVGAFVRVCYCADEAIAAMDEYMRLETK